MKLFITTPESLTETPETWDQDLLVEIACLEAEGEKVALIDNACLRFGVEDLIGYIKEVTNTVCAPNEEAEVILWRPKDVFREEYLNRITSKEMWKADHAQNFTSKPPYPAWHHLPLQSYFENPPLDYNADTLMAKTRFHFKWNVGDHLKYTPQRMCRMLTYTKLRHPYDFASFHDDVTENKEWTQKFLLEMDNQDLTGTFKWGAKARIESVSHSDLESLRERQCTYLNYGVINIVDLGSKDEVLFNQLEAAIRGSKKDGVTPIVRVELNPCMSLDALIKVAKLLVAEEVNRRPVIKPYTPTSLDYWSYVELIGAAELIDSGDLDNLSKIRD